MKQLSEIVEFYDQFPEIEHEMAFALLFRAEGSSYRKVGARMLIHLSGNYAGGISGGCLEADVQKKAKLNLLLARHEILSFNTAKNSNSAGSNLGCDGKLEILLHPVNKTSEHNPINGIKSILASRKSELLFTIIKSFNPKFEDLIGNVYTEIQLKELVIKNKELAELKSICAVQPKSKKSEVYTIPNQLEILAEIIPPKIRLIIVGGHRDVISLVNMASLLGWDLIVCGKKNSSLPKSVRQIETDELNSSLIDTATAVVFMSHDFDSDLKNFPKVIDSDAFYIGSLGPEKRKLKMLSAIDKIDYAAKIAGPIGLNIGAKSPEEIALATCAEIQLIFTQKTAINATLINTSNEANVL